MVTAHPIIPGFNPDPSICRVSNNYYLVTSTFQFFPGVPVYHSQDLTRWTQIGNAIHRPQQLKDLDQTVINGGVWAPTIRHHNGIFYICTTIVFTDKPATDFTRWKNFIVTANDPAGPWSDPVFFEYPGYDTSLFFTEDNRCFIQGSFYYRIRPEISQIELDVKTGKALSAPKRIWSGTPGAKAPEAPHILYKNGWYYLIIAEGGTEFGHSVSLARARQLCAPENEWEEYPGNPLLTHRDLPGELIQCTGHADIFDDPQGNYWMVLLAVRAYDGERYPMGRESWLIPITWKDEDAWPSVQLPLEAPRDCSHPGPNVEKVLKIETNVCSFGQGDKPSWNPSWLWLRTPDFSRYLLTDRDQTTDEYLGCVLKASQIGLSDAKHSPTMILMRQCHVRCRATVQLDLASIENDTTAGLAAYLDCNHYEVVSCHRKHDSVVLECLQETVKFLDIDTVTLAIEADERSYRFEYKLANAGWNVISTTDAKDLTFGFTGVLFGLFAVGNGDVHFSRFTYQVIG